MNNQNAKADKGKPKLSLVPTEIINCIARCREYGTKKYHDPDNWKDVEKGRYIDAAYRHWIKYVEDNNSIDEESGLPHLYHCCCNLAFLCEFEKVEREVRETQEAIQRVETREKQSRKHISAPPDVINDVIKKALDEERETAKINDDISKLNCGCTGRRCPMQYGYDNKHCPLKDCPWREERK